MKLPRFFSLDDGAIGRFVKKVPIGTAQVDVYYYPPGVVNTIKRPLVIKRVPASAVTEPLQPAGCPYDEGIVILKCGSYGRSALADLLDMTSGRDLARLEKEKAIIEAESQMRMHQLSEKGKGIREGMREVKESRDIIERTKRSSADPFARRRPPMDDYE